MHFATNSNILTARTATSLGLAAVSARVLAAKYAVKPGVTQVVVPVPGKLVAARDHKLCASSRIKSNGQQGRGARWSTGTQH